MTPEQVAHEALVARCYSKPCIDKVHENDANAAVAAIRAAGHLLGPDKVAVDREALAYVLKNVQPNNTHPDVTRANIKALRAALSEPQPKPEGTS